MGPIKLFAIDGLMGVNPKQKEVTISLMTILMSPIYGKKFAKKSILLASCINRWNGKPCYTVVIASLINFLLLSGFFIKRDRIPAYWVLFHYLSLVKYPYERVMQNDLDNPNKCFKRGEHIFDNTPLGVLPAVSKAEVLLALSRALVVNVTTRSCMMTRVDILQLPNWPNWFFRFSWD